MTTIIKERWEFCDPIKRINKSLQINQKTNDGEKNKEKHGKGSRQA